MCPDVSAFQTDVCQHSVIKAFQACLYPATMSIGFDIVYDAAQLPNKVETGSIAHFNGTVCNDDDHFNSPFSTMLRFFCPKSGAVHITAQHCFFAPHNLYVPYMLSA
jgi:hypothetical protein